MAPAQPLQLDSDTNGETTAARAQGILFIVAAVAALGGVCLLIACLVTAFRRWRKYRRERDRLHIISQNTQGRELPTLPYSRSSSSSCFMNSSSPMPPPGHNAPITPEKASATILPPMAVYNPRHLGAFEPGMSPVHDGILMSDGRCACGCGQMTERGVSAPRRKTKAAFEDVPLEDPSPYRMS